MCEILFFCVVFIFYFDKDQVVQCDLVQINLIPQKASFVGSSQKLLHHKGICKATATGKLVKPKYFCANTIVSF